MTPNRNLSRAMIYKNDSKNETMAKNKTSNVIFLNKEEFRYLELTEQEYLKNPPKGELIVCKNYMETESTKLSLAYKFEIYAIVPLSRNFVYVDANTGKIIHVNSLIRGIDGIADTRYSGTRTISTEYYNGSYRLRDYDNYRGNGIETYNMLNKGANYHK